MSADFLAESRTVVRRAATAGDLHREFATRVHALIFDGATMRDLRALAAAWRARRDELLAQDMGH